MTLRRGVILSEMIASMLIWMILIPILTSLGLLAVSEMAELRNRFVQSHERAYAFQRYLIDLQDCREMQVSPRQLSCIQDAKEIIYDCNKKRLRRKENGRSAYLSEYWHLGACQFRVSENQIIFTADSTVSGVSWSYPASDSQRVFLD